MGNGVDLVKDSVFMKHYVHNAASTASYPNANNITGVTAIATSATNGINIDLTDAKGNFFECNYVKIQYMLVATADADYGRHWAMVSPSCHLGEFVNGENVIVSGGLNATGVDGSGVPGFVLYPDKTTAKEEETYRAAPNHPIRSLKIHFCGNRQAQATAVYHILWVTYGHESKPHNVARNMHAVTGEE